MSDDAIDAIRWASRRGASLMLHPGDMRAIIDTLDASRREVERLTSERDAARRAALEEAIAAVREVEGAQAGYVPIVLDCLDAIRALDPAHEPSPARTRGRQIRDRRVGAGLSLRAVARAAGLDTVRLGEIERGARQPATAEEMDAIERALLDPPVSPAAPSASEEACVVCGAGDATEALDLMRRRARRRGLDEAIAVVARQRVYEEGVRDDPVTVPHAHGLINEGGRRAAAALGYVERALRDLRRTPST